MRVTYNGKPYRGILSAFLDLGLPVNKHGRFRLELYANKKATFVHNGKEYDFSVPM
jgi:hypothetical protein